MGQIPVAQCGAAGTRRPVMRSLLLAAALTVSSVAIAQSTQTEEMQPPAGQTTPPAEEMTPPDTNPMPEPMPQQPTEPAMPPEQAMPPEPAMPTTPPPAEPSTPPTPDAMAQPAMAGTPGRTRQHQARARCARYCGDLGSRDRAGRRQSAGQRRRRRPGRSQSQPVAGLRQHDGDGGVSGLLALRHGPLRAEIRALPASLRSMCRVSRGAVPPAPRHAPAHVYCRYNTLML